MTGLQRVLLGATAPARVSEVVWTPQGVIFRRGGDWLRVPLEGGEPVGCDAPEKEEKPAPAGPIDPPAGRAKQRTRATSPDGAWRAEHHEGGVRLVEVATGTVTPVIAPSTDAPGVLYGTADWVYGEELDQNDAMWWSPDGRFLAFYAFDVSREPGYELPRGWDKLRTKSFTQRYPKAGDPNALVGILVLDRATGRMATVDVGDDPEQYVYGVSFAPGDAGLLFHRTNRRQDRLQLCLADPVSGRSRVIVEETQPTFQENRPLMRFLSDGDRFLWGSERTGFRNLELRRLSDPAAVTVLTRHPFPVGEVVRVDESQGLVWYTAFSAELPMLAQLHRVGLDGAGEIRLTPADRGWSRFEIAPDGTRVVASGQTPERPPLVHLLLADGSAQPLATLAEADLRAFQAQRMPPPELFRCPAADGTTPIYGVLFFPPGFDPYEEDPNWHTRSKWGYHQVRSGPRVCVDSGRAQLGTPCSALLTSIVAFPFVFTPLQMIKFFYRDIFRLDIFADVKYLMRFDDDSCFRSPMPNVFQVIVCWARRVCTDSLLTSSPL